jgi:hypothetical protein
MEANESKGSLGGTKETRENEGIPATKTNGAVGKRGNERREISRGRMEGLKK